MLLGNFLNLHAARSARHEHGHTPLAIDEHAELELALDIEPFLHQQPVNHVAFLALFAGVTSFIPRMRSAWDAALLLLISQALRRRLSRGPRHGSALSQPPREFPAAAPRWRALCLF